MHNTELYTEAERKTSATYNEVQRLTESQDSLYARLDGRVEHTWCGGSATPWIQAVGEPIGRG